MMVSYSTVVMCHLFVFGRLFSTVAEEDKEGGRRRGTKKEEDEDEDEDSSQ